MARGPVEIGLTRISRRTPTLVPQAYPDGRHRPAARATLVVISGGARGITAACALELARRARPHAGPARPLAGARGRAGVDAGDRRGCGDVKKALLENEFAAHARHAGRGRTPPEAAHRQPRGGPHPGSHPRRPGPWSHYYAVDVRDAGQVEAASRRGARRASARSARLIHGAGRARGPPHRRQERRAVRTRVRHQGEGLPGAAAMPCRRTT
ncbi:MAG: hypothetical protein MZV70_51480 [Desulfobacterales bacterium]|nr:hypothetical protein [Desulfobacterales bacterium]